MQINDISGYLPGRIVFFLVHTQSLIFFSIVVLSDLVADQIVTCVLFSDSMVQISNLLVSVWLVVCLWVLFFKISTLLYMFTMRR